MSTERAGRLGVGTIGAGRVGAVLASALAGAGHALTGIAAISDASRERAAVMLPSVPVLPIPEVVERSELVMLSVPETELAMLVAGLADAGAWQPGQLVLHTAARFGTGVLDPARRAGAIPLAVHPAMNFTGTSIDLARLRGTWFAVTAPAPVLPIGQALVVEMGGEPFVVAEDDRVGLRRGHRDGRLVLHRDRRPGQRHARRHRRRPPRRGARLARAQHRRELAVPARPRAQVRRDRYDRRGRHRPAAGRWRVTEVTTGTRVVSTIAELRELLAEQRAGGASVALVPTMGALHDGHLALVRRARELADVVVVSIFVNPLQFGPGEDLDRYPRTLDADVAALAEHGVEFVFAPAAEVMYPAGQVETTIAAGHIGTLYEGASRPGHFDGMLTVVVEAAQHRAARRRRVRPEGRAAGVPRAPHGARVRRADRRRRRADRARGRRARALESQPLPRRVAARRPRSRCPRRCVPPRPRPATGSPRCSPRAPPPSATTTTSPSTTSSSSTPRRSCPVGDDATGDAVVLVAARVGSTRLIDNTTISLG